MTHAELLKRFVGPACPETCSGELIHQGQGQREPCIPGSIESPYDLFQGRPYDVYVCDTCCDTIATSVLDFVVTRYTTPSPWNRRHDRR